MWLGLFMVQVLDLCQPDTAGSSSKEDNSIPHQATFLVQLALAPSSPEAAAQPAARSVLLQVAISYTSSICYAVDDAGLLDEAAGDAAAHEGGEQELPTAQQEQLQQAEQTPNPQPSEDPHQQQQQLQRVEELKRNASQEAGQYPPVLHDRPDARQLLGSPTGSPNRTDALANGLRVAPAAAAAVASSKLGSAVAPTEEAAVPLTAELCVKVIRACGLQVGNNTIMLSATHLAMLCGVSLQLTNSVIVVGLTLPNEPLVAPNRGYSFV
jgi:hypothetical protein